MLVPSRHECYRINMVVSTPLGLNSADRDSSSPSIVILLADDDEDDRMLTADALNISGFSNELRSVRDGEELMDYLCHRGKHAPPATPPRPGLILLDLNMPRKDGLEALREMKDDPALRCIPVVILTTSRTEADIERAYNLGANSFIVKPVTFTDLANVMKVTSEYWFKFVQLPTGPKEQKL
jgi:CheY-like chemotaxis protein